MVFYICWVGFLRCLSAFAVDLGQQYASPESSDLFLPPLGVGSENSSTYRKLMIQWRRYYHPFGFSGKFVCWTLLPIWADLQEWYRCLQHWHMLHQNCSIIFWNISSIRYYKYASFLCHHMFHVVGWRRNWNAFSKTTTKMKMKMKNHILTKIAFFMPRSVF